MQRTLAILAGLLFIHGVNAMGEFTNFKALKRPNSPNYYVACPKDYCNIKPDINSQIYPVSIKLLHSLWLKSIDSEPRFKLLHAKGNQLEYVQRSLIFRFPDFVSVQLIDLGADKSSLALLSRAQYGYYDFGVNKKRVQRLLRQLSNAVEPYVKK